MIPVYHTDCYNTLTKNRDFQNFFEKSKLLCFEQNQQLAFVRNDENHSDRQTYIVLHRHLDLCFFL